MQCGGSERVISMLANYWVKEGHKVTIVTTDREEPSYFELDSKIKRIGILKGISTSKIFSVSRKFSSILKLRKAILNEQPDIVFAFQEKTALYTLISLIGKKPFKVAAVRNNPEFKKLGQLMSLLRIRFYKKADVVVVQTTGIKNWFYKNLNLDTEVIPNPVEKLRKGKDLSEEKTIYACGRLVPQKGFYNLIDIFYNLSANYPEWKLVILGDGDEKESLIQRARDLGIECKVAFEGSVKNPVDYYSTGGVFAFTSEYEGYPNALCEAMASGMAVVSFDCPSGPSDLIQKGVNGFLVKAGDKESFQVKLEKLMKDDELRLRLGKGATRIKDELAIEKIAEQWLDLKG